MTSRREFLATSAALYGASAFGGTARAASAFGSADTIITGGTFITMESDTAATEALAIKNGRILAVGTAAEIDPLAGPATQRIDARGLTIVPGFIDAHSHPMMANEAISTDVNFRTIDEVIESLRKRAANTPAGHWVLGHMYDDTKFVEGRPLLRTDLDKVSRDHPIFVRHRGGHTAVINSKGFEIAKLTIDTPDPDGGKFYRDNGQFTGKVAELALDVFEQVGVWPKIDRETLARNAELITRRMAATGLTSTTDAFGTMPSWLAYSDCHRDETLSCRIDFMPSSSAWQGEDASCYELFKRAGILSGFGDDMLKVGAVKFAADGSASERTMRMSTPYKDRPDDYGILTMTADALDDAVSGAYEAGFRVGVHANGDVTIDMVLDSYEKLLRGNTGRNTRLRIEHCSLVNPSILKRMKDLGVIPTPFYTYAHYHGEKWHEYGPEKMEWMFAHKSMLDAGIPVAPASDFTPGPYEPLMALQSLVTRKDLQGNVWGPSQRVSMMEAMTICTRNGAYASFDENKKGSLRAGKLADIVLLSDNPFSVDPDALQDIQIIRTIMNGRTVFEA
ncbi:amidohydrolase [Kordiimonas sediminis]|uniref:Amidohydrolase n=1 Tax=Kordiimonas sediminis TaxID=1735581 RepID=A0A919E6S5_9PROT|nr:amidohydrolase [Kordiimonas sediminis]GHF17796.1 amidohydrolase [Kordiimonas sediminis]